MKRKQLLESEDISITFGGLKAVNGFSCTVHSGELVGLIGPNGAGKTTVFNMLSGIYPPTSGEIRVLNRQGKVQRTAHLAPAELNRIGVSRTFQNIRLFGNLTVEDNVRIALHSSRNENPFEVLFRLPRFFEDEQRMIHKTHELLELFALAAKKYELARNLPYGEQRKLEIARALAAEPILLLLDEPAAGMNPQETDSLMKLISLIRERFKLTILLIEHDMRFVMGICERIIVLDYGKIIAEGTPHEIRSNPAVIKAYLGTEGVNHA
ncbi:MAG: ABC transporter ATP-binding protein [Treponema sp.]|jgi:branched-chain amino acid transport system ATP-binding protein|nr:ABC transporter ATP-binding protein [Treponema sp.]